MHLKIPGSRFVTIPGAGHVAPLQQPELFARGLLAFMGVGL
jgi:pimeloyl-ACP methyl ester carboxylesterase